MGTADTPGKSQMQVLYPTGRGETGSMQMIFLDKEDKNPSSVLVQGRGIIVVECDPKTEEFSSE